jgi:hypothetical protein
VYVYDHEVGAAVIGAGLYRRNGGTLQFPQEYDGDYFFSDFVTGLLFRLKQVGGVWQLAPPVEGQPAEAWGTGFRNASDWTVGPDGALWWTDPGLGSNRVHRIGFTTGPTDTTPAAPAGDLFDLQGRRVPDARTNGIYFRPGSRKRAVIR